MARITQNQELIKKGDSYDYIFSSKKIILVVPSVLIKTGKSFRFTLQNDCQARVYIFTESPKNKIGNFNFNLVGSNAKVEVNLLHIGSKFGTCRLNINMNHLGKNCFSRMNIRRVQYDSSQSQCHTLINITKKAFGSDAYLSDKTLLISESVKTESIPSLEILCNNVKASHGATVGRLSGEDLFYLRSRGLTEEKAKSVLIQGFIQTVLPADQVLRKFTHKKF